MPKNYPPSLKEHAINNYDTYHHREHAYEWLVRHYKNADISTQEYILSDEYVRHLPQVAKDLLISTGILPQPKENMEHNYQLFSVNAYNPETGDIVLKQKNITAKNQQSARDKAIRLINEDVDLDTIKVVVTPLG